MNLPAIQEEIRAQGLDGWLFFDHHRRDPLAYRILSIPGADVPTRRWYYYIPATGDPRGLVHRIEPHSLESLPGKMTQYSTWQEQRQGVLETLSGARTIAMQYSPECRVPYVSMVDAGTIELVRGLGLEIASSANLIQLFEARWSARQLESHREAGRRVDGVRRTAFQKVADEISSGRGITELDVKDLILRAFADQGLMTDHGPIVAVNANASDPHYEPSPERHAAIRPDDLLLIDLWAKLKDPGDAVYYDITWTGFCGLRIPDRMCRVFEVVSGARDRAVDLVKSRARSGGDLRGFEVDDAARDFIRANGLGEYFIHRTGHSIGTEVHGAGANMDNFESHDDRRIVPHTCFSIEPGVYLREFGIRSEVNVFVAEGDAGVTGEVQTALVSIGNHH